MPNALAKKITLIFAAFFAFAMQLACAQALSVEAKTVNGHREIVLRNQSNCPLSVKLTMPESTNVKTYDIWPIIKTVPAHGEVLATRLYANHANMRYSYKMTSEYMQGDFKAQPDPHFLYRLPFKEGLSFTISQAADGPKTTHTQPESFNAIDFTMPEGTPIVAARGGVVVKTESHFQEGGYRPELMTKANFVKILHDDGTLSGYAHLRYGGVTVQEGDRVQAGDVIGFSGSTGYSTGPHLHFAVVKIALEQNKFVEQSIPIQFFVGKPAKIFTPRAGLITTANYTEAVPAPDLMQQAASKKNTKTRYWPGLLMLVLVFIYLLYIRVKTEKKYQDTLMQEINEEYDRLKL